MVTWLVPVTCGNQTSQKMNPFPTHSKYGENYSDAFCFWLYLYVWSMERVLYQSRKHQLTYQSTSPTPPAPWSSAWPWHCCHPALGIWMNRGGGLQTVPGIPEIMPLQTMGGNSSLILFTILCIFGWTPQMMALTTPATSCRNTVLVCKSIVVSEGSKRDIGGW